MKDNYSDEMIKVICKEYSISIAEFRSLFKYPPLPEARQLYCLALTSFGVKIKEISRLTGYSPARVFYSINTGRKLMDSTPFFKKRHDMLLNLLNLQY